MPKSKLIPLSTPGEILVEEFLSPLNISQYRLAKDIGVPPRRINEIVHGKRAITADTSLRLAKYFRMSDLFWLRLQIDYDMRLAKRKLDKKLEKAIKPFRKMEAQERPGA